MSLRKTILGTRQQFTVRAIFLVTAIIAIVCAWLHYQRQWKLERYDVLNRMQSRSTFICDVFRGGGRGPWSQRVLGEQWFLNSIVAVADELTEEDIALADQAKSVFPEAQFFFLSRHELDPESTDRVDRF